MRANILYKNLFCSDILTKFICENQDCKIPRTENFDKKIVEISLFGLTPGVQTI